MTVTLGRAQAWSLGWHDLDVAHAEKRLDEQAVAALAGGDGRTGIAAVVDGGGAIETQAGALLLGAMTADTVLDQDGLDVAGEVDIRGGKGQVWKQSDHAQGQECSHENRPVGEGKRIARAGLYCHLRYRNPGRSQREKAKGTGFALSEGTVP